ncbi:MAG: winged helix-turn-helix transcriptional regulator, partial [Salegentibacter sp.]
MKLDRIDLKILQQLQEDSKMTNKELSNQLGLSVTAIYERIKRLEREGVISKYVALVDPEKVEKSFMVFCQIRLIQHAR